MKTTAQQIKVLQDYLYQTLTYREAYEEIYDHILTAIEHQPDGVVFEDAINGIINNDFGGYKNLLKVEESIKDALVGESIKRYLRYLLSYFRFPAVFGTIVGALLIYTLLLQLNFNFKITVGLLFLVCIVPGIILMLRLYNTGYILDTTRKSSKDKLFETLAGIPIRVGVVLVFITTFIEKVNTWDNKQYLLTVVLLAGILYSMALYRLYKHELKTEATR